MKQTFTEAGRALLVAGLILATLPFITFPSAVLEAKKYPHTPSLSSIRQMAMGGQFSAAAFDEYLLMVNPAALGSKNRFLQAEEGASSWFFLPVSFNAELITQLVKTTQTLSKLNRIRNSEDENLLLNDFSSTFARSSNPILIRQLLLDFSYLNDTWGISFFPLHLSIGKIDYLADLPPSAYLNVNFYSTLVVGYRPYSFSVLGTKNLHLGFNAKLFYLLDYVALVEVVELISSQNLVKELVGSTPQGRSAWEGFGFGLDSGVLWEVDLNDKKGFKHQLAGSFVITDTFSMLFPIILKSYSPAFSFVFPNFRAGFAYTLPNYLPLFFEETVFSVELDRWFAPSYTMSTRFRLGISSNLVRLGKFTWNASLGLNKGYPTIGTLLHWNFYRLAYAFYQDELGNFSGSLPSSVNQFEISFYF